MLSNKQIKTTEKLKIMKTQIKIDQAIANTLSAFFVTIIIISAIAA